MKTNIIPSFTGKRWLKVILRTLHLVGFAGVFVATINESPGVVSWYITVISGSGLLILEALSNLVWFVQVRALVMYVKFLLLYLLFVFPDFAWHLLVLMVILSGIISHAPSSLRYYSFIHHKKVKSLHDIRG